MSEAAMTPAELWDQEVQAGRDRLDQLAGEVTQREWLNITKVLDRTRQEIGGDPGLTMLALGWVKEKRDHGGASWERLLDMTDTQLEDLHGFPTGGRPDEGSHPLEPAETPADDQAAGEPEADIHA